MEFDPHQMVKDISKAEEKAAAAHDRLDELKTDLKGDLKEIRETLGAIKDWMHETKGYAAGAMAVGGLAGGVVGALLHYLLK